VALSILGAAILVVGGTIVLFLSNCTGPTKGTQVLSTPTLVAAFAALALFGVALVLLFWLRAPKWVILSNEGVKIAYPLWSRSFRWSEMIRVVGVGMGTVTFRPNSAPLNIVGGWFNITPEQARAIITDPRCPAVDLKDEWRRSILQG